MKVDPKYGYYPWWPEDGNDWVHPEDVELARQMIPSPRVFRRDGEQGPFVILHYGDRSPARHAHTVARSRARGI